MMHNKKTIKQQLIFYHVIIIVIMAISSIFILLVNFSLNSRYNNILDADTQFNDYLKHFNEVNDKIEHIVKNERIEENMSFFDSTEELLAAADTLSKCEKYSEMWRQTQDLWNLANTYTTEAISAVRLMEAGFADAAFPIYENTLFLHDISIDYFNDSYYKLLAITNTERIEIANRRQALYIASVGTIIGLVLISILLSSRFSDQIARPIRKLTEQVSKMPIAEGSLEPVNPSSENTEEVYALMRAYNQLSTRINTQVEQLKQSRDTERKLHEEEKKNLETQKLLKISELRALQAQINPHFLFNTLNMIHSVAYIEDATRTSDLLEVFGKYLRYNLDNFDKIVTVKEELSNVEDYFIIQKRRMGERIHYSIHCDASAESAQIPSLIIQPLVENSIIHGISQYLGDGEVQVSVRSYLNHRIRICVTDNGLGIPATELLKIQTSLNADKTTIMTERLGLRNVVSRLKLFCDDDVNVSITSNRNQYTVVVLDIPYLQKGNHYEI